jgi:3-hydroxyisobutyrate dehydrogenase-like beta-hydroxyacid dehydrogenase
MSTTSPTASRAIAERLAPHDYVEAPVSGSKPKAEDGTLTIFAGGEPAAFERALPLFEAMGERIVRVGPLGHGQMAKLLTNTMGAVNAAVLAEAVRTAKAAGLDEDAFLEVAAGSAGASGMLNLKGRPMFEETYEPALFKLEHMLKDVRHTLDEARALGIDLKLPALAEDLYARAADAGHGEQDFAAVYTAVDGDAALE